MARERRKDLRGRRVARPRVHSSAPAARGTPLLRITADGFDLPQLRQFYGGQGPADLDPGLRAAVERASATVTSIEIGRAHV